MTVTLSAAVGSGTSDQASRALEYVAGVMQTVGQPRLTADQERYALQVIEAALEPGSVAALCLEGPAGTGKTTVLVWIILALSWLEKPAAVCAYTHKACSVLRHKLAAWMDEFEIVAPTTVHALLNLRLKRTKPGGPLESVQYKRPELGAFSLIIVDECSMIGRDLYEVIVSSCAEAGLPVLFAGDPCQLQPVNEKALSRTFGVKPHLPLTEVLRHDGAILDLATKIRTNKFVPVIKAAQGSTTEVRTYSGRAALVQHWLDEVRTAHGSGMDGDIVMLTYTNAERRNFNNMARQAIHGSDVPRFMAGDVVMALEPVMDGDTVLFQNNQDIEIKEAKLLIGYEPVADLGVSFDVWELKTTVGITIYVLADAEEALFKSTLERIKKKIVADIKAAEKRVAVARAEGASGYQLAALTQAVDGAKRAWQRYFYPLQEAFAQVDYKYAMTIHKSQGSEWPQVYVNNDYTKSRDEDVQLLYVAVTRASRVLHHVDNAPRK